MNETWLATRLYVFEGNDCPSLLLSIDDRAVVVSIDQLIFYVGQVFHVPKK